MPHVNLYLTRHYREQAPRVWLGKGGTYKGFHLTLDEAEALARELGEIAATARHWDEGGQR
jgi:hypothetical protein